MESSPLGNGWLSKPAHCQPICLVDTLSFCQFLFDELQSHFSPMGSEGELPQGLRRRQNAKHPWWYTKHQKGD